MDLTKNGFNEILYCMVAHEDSKCTKYATIGAARTSPPIRTCSPNLTQRFNFVAHGLQINLQDWKSLCVIGFNSIEVVGISLFDQAI